MRDGIVGEMWDLGGQKGFCGDQSEDHRSSPRNSHLAWVSKGD